MNEEFLESTCWTIADIRQRICEESKTSFFEELLSQIESSGLPFEEDFIVANERYQMVPNRHYDTSIHECLEYSKFCNLELHDRFDFDFSEGLDFNVFYILPANLFKLLKCEFALCLRDFEHIFDGGGAECAYASMYFEHQMNTVWRKKGSLEFYTLREWLAENDMVEIIADEDGHVAEVPEVKVHRGVQYANLYGTPE